MSAIKPQSSGSKPKTVPYQRYLSKLLKFLLVIIAFFSYLIIVPLFITLLSPLYLYRLFVIILAKIFKPDVIKIVGCRDAIVGLDDVTKKCECVLNLFLIYSGEPDIQKIRDVFQKKVLEAKDSQGNYSYEKFKHYYEYWMGYAFWKEEKDFNLQHHIRFCEETEAQLSENTNNNEDNEDSKTESGRSGGNVITEGDFVRILGPLSTRPFSKGIAPWEILIVRNYLPAVPKLHTDYVPTVAAPSTCNEGGDSKPKFGIIFRVHHALGDGFSLMKCIMANWSDEPPSSIPTAPVRKISCMQKIYMYIGIILFSPYYHLRQFVLDVDRNLWHLRENKLTKDWHTTMSEKIPLKNIKEIGKAGKVSTTAVLLGGFAGAIRKFLIESGQESKIPEVMRALAPMPWKNHPMNSLQNHWTLGNMVFPVGLDNAQQRLIAAEKSVRLLKRSPVLFTNFGTVPFLFCPPSWLTDFWATNWMTTMILSNFPGPNFICTSFESYPMEDVMFWLPQMRGSSSMGVGFMSYNGGIRISVTIDKAIMPDEASASRLNSCINEELKSLRSLVSSYTEASV